MSSTFCQRYYKALSIESDWVIDLRHIIIIYKLLISGLFRHAIEIGAYHGASTCAFVEAAERNQYLTASVCDSRITNNVRELISQSCAEPRIELIECSSVVALEKFIKCQKTIDFALLDGSHTYRDNAYEVALLRCLGARTLLIHDINNISSDQYDRNYLFDGPKKLMQRFQNCSNWFIVEDSHLRSGERTDRGLALVTRDHEVWNKGAEIFTACATLSESEVRLAAESLF